MVRNHRIWELYLSDKIMLLPGLRYEYTDTTYDAFAYDDNEETLTPVSGSKDYGHLLPNIHLRYLLDKESNLRAALTRTLARPNYEDAVPRAIREDDRWTDLPVVVVSAKAEEGRRQDGGAEATVVDWLGVFLLAGAGLLVMSTPLPDLGWQPYLGAVALGIVGFMTMTSCGTTAPVGSCRRARLPPRR